MGYLKNNITLAYIEMTLLYNTISIFRGDFIDQSSIGFEVRWFNTTYIYKQLAINFELIDTVM